MHTTYKIAFNLKSYKNRGRILSRGFKNPGECDLPLSVFFELMRKEMSISGVMDKLSSLLSGLDYKLPKDRASLILCSVAI